MARPLRIEYEGGICMAANAELSELQIDVEFAWWDTYHLLMIQEPVGLRVIVASRWESGSKIA